MDDTILLVVGLVVGGLIVLGPAIAIFKLINSNAVLSARLQTLQEVERQMIAHGYNTGMGDGCLEVFAIVGFFTVCAACLGAALFAAGVWH
jgi:hypothetical protein